MKLFDMIPEHRALLDLIEEVPGGELNPEAEAALEAFFAEIGEAEAPKLDSYAYVIRTLESQAAVAQAEADQYLSKKKTAENAVKRLKDRVKLYLEVTGRTKATTTTGRTFAIQANGGVAPLDLSDRVKSQPETLPSQFQRLKVEADTAAIRKALEDGEVLDFATILPRGNHLRIK